MPHPKAPLYPLNQCYLFRNTSCTSAAPQIILFFSVRHTGTALQWHQKAPHFSSAPFGEQGMVWCTHGCKEIYFQVSSKRCSSGFLFHLRLPSLGRTLEKKAGQEGVRSLAVVRRDKLPAPLGAGSLRELGVLLREEGTKQGARRSRPAGISAGVKQRMERHRGAVVMLWQEQCG